MRLAELHYIQLLNEATQEIYCRSSNAKHYIKAIQDRLEQGVVDARILDRLKNSLEEMKMKHMYIGINDINEKEIYHGDVVKVSNLRAQLQKAEIVGEVTFSWASFGVEVAHVNQWEGYSVPPPEIGDVWWFLNIANSKEIEVVGNSYR